MSLVPVFSRVLEKHAFSKMPLTKDFASQSIALIFDVF